MMEAGTPLGLLQAGTGKHGGSRPWSMAKFEMVRRGSRIQRTQLTVLGVSKLRRRKLSGSRLERREVNEYR